MSDYTPNLSDIRLTYALSKDTKPGRSTEEWWAIRDAAQAEFDRAIAKVRADAKVEALREAVSDFQHSVGVGEFDEQTRRDGNRHAHIDEAWEYQGPYMDWLLNRADNLEAS